MAKILLVEDDLDLARMVVDGLTSEHHSVVAMADGLDGLDMLKRSVYDVIVLDWNLPGMEGIEILRKFRQNGGTTPVIMLTGKGGIADKEAGFNVGADDYLTKPFDIRDPEQYPQSQRHRTRSNQALGYLWRQTDAHLAQRLYPVRIFDAPPGRSL